MFRHGHWLHVRIIGSLTGNVMKVPDWVALERARTDQPPDGLDVNERAELARLRTDNTELRMDRAF